MTQAILVAESRGARLDKAQALLADKPDGVIEAVAREAGLPTRDVLLLLPASERIMAPPERFEDAWRAMSGWGEILFIVHTADIVLECKGALPTGTFGRGYFNIHGDSPIGGHVKADNCAAIHFVDRLFHGRRSCSVQFFNAEGEAMFKVFVRRDAARELVGEQVAMFEALRGAIGRVAG